MNRSLATQATILIVDSDPLMLTAIAAVLNLSGHECHCARDSVAAFKAARGLNLDLIVCDNDLPEGSGVDLCRDLKREIGARDAATIILASERTSAQWAEQEGAPHSTTTSAPGSTTASSTTENASEYRLIKPIDPRALQDLVERALWMPHLVRTRLEMAHATPGEPLGRPPASPRGAPLTLASHQLADDSARESRSGPKLRA